MLTWRHMVKSRHWVTRLVAQGVADARREILAAPLKPRPSTWSDQHVTLTWLGHATVLINFHGVRILTDPVFSPRIGLDAGLAVIGPKRYVAPALRIADLPPIDVVLLSHAHLDHMDLPSLRKLPKPALAVTARATADILDGTPVEKAQELGWGDATTYRGAAGELRITAFEVKHWGARWRRDRHRGYNGYLLSREGKSIVFGGDTALTPLFASLRARGPHLAAIMPIAAYDPWIRNHCTPEQAFEMTDAAGAARIIPVHHQTFKLSDEPMHEPIERLKAAMGKEPERLALEQVGGTCRLT